MGIWDSIKKQFIDVIHWTEEDDALLAWRFPMRDMEIQYGAQLTVRASQAAVFVNEGTIADVFGPGRYRLVTQTIPVLTALRHWDKLFESPFKSDVYFFSTRLRVDQKWGTPNPIAIRDAEFGAVRLRAFGVYSYRLADAKLFHTKVSGTRESYGVEELAGQLRATIAGAMANLFAGARVPFLDMVANQNTLAAGLRESLSADFAALGLDLTSLVIENLSLPEELQQTLDHRIGMNFAGDMQRYTHYRTAASIDTAAANPGGVAGIGAGLASGLAMGRAMTQALSPGATPASAAGEGAAPPASRDVIALIERLHELRMKGAITEAEFEAKKAELLGKVG
jgi:membrane protease subunit (stomatin/prohibitin family)